MTSSIHTELLGLLGPLAGGIVVADVGAHGTSEADVHAPVLAAPDSTLVGFEPNRKECDRLNAESAPGCRYEPFAIGDGRTCAFHVCASPLTSSLLEPNLPLLQRYENLADLCTVVHREATATTRLDDVPGLAAAHFLKIDIQGMTLPALLGAQRLLASTLVVHAETEFQPIYRDEALFSECEQHLRAHGFMFHHFHRLEGRRILAGQMVVGQAFSQTLWGDSVFVPDHSRLDRLDAQALARLAWIMHAAYGAHDFALHCLDRADARIAANLAVRYHRLLSKHALLS